MRWPWILAGVAACGGRGSAVGQAVTTLCPTDTVEGVDVYAGDGAVDWTMVKASGRQFAFIKATQGDYNRQATFATNWAGAQTAGVLRSPYHFFDPTIDGTAQAQAFLDELSSVGGLQLGDLPPMLDLECPTASSESAAQPDCEHPGDPGWAPTATIIQRTFDWLGAVEQATGRKAIVYSYTSWFASVGFTDARLAGYPLFVASFHTCASVPDPWTSAVFWQYSASGSVPGIASQADVDRFVGSAGDLAGLTGTTPDGGVPPDAASAEAGGGGGCGCRSSSVGAIAFACLALPFVLGRRRAPPRRARPAGRRSSGSATRRR
jgi:GH25 family lysozyme M1 (1,4-beta-N-acetylmuramidase)